MADSYGSNGLYYMRLLRITQRQHYSIMRLFSQSLFSREWESMSDMRARHGFRAADSCAQIKRRQGRGHVVPPYHRKRTNRSRRQVCGDYARHADSRSEVYACLTLVRRAGMCEGSGAEPGRRLFLFLNISPGTKHNDIGQLHFFPLDRSCIPCYCNPSL